MNLSPYAFSKAKNLELLENLKKWFKFRYEVIYFYNVYGERQICKGDMATVVAEQARNKLKLVAGKVKADGTSDRIVTYNVRLENLSKAATRIRTTMEKEFPGAKGIVSMQRNGNLVTFGYQTSASADKIGDWLEIVIEDLGLENVSLNVDGNNFTISNDGPDSPPAKNRPSVFLNKNWE
jgi:nucleoside-diphosphate-sugar epimerase